jgi:hypothetical protein
MMVLKYASDLHRDASNRAKEAELGHPRLIPNESVPGAALPPWERFEKFVGRVARVPKEEADKGRSRELKNNASESGQKK